MSEEDGSINDLSNGEEVVTPTEPEAVPRRVKMNQSLKAEIVSPDSGRRRNR